MLSQEKPYDFKKRLLKIHNENVRNYRLTPRQDEVELTDEISIVLHDTSDVVLTAARDFADYLFTSMDISASIAKKSSKCKQNIILRTSHNIGKAAGYMGSRINISDDVVEICAYDDRGAAQAFYYLEDLMTLRHAPYLPKGVTERKAMFSPRISQSPFGINSYPDEAFSQMAHLGYDAIDVWLKDAYTDLKGDYIDLRLLSERAKKYGIDLYIQLYAPHSVHPSDENAESFYDNLYGKIFEVAPLVKGITLLGEANQFQSMDKNVGKAPYINNFSENIPIGKTSPGWWPCNDYPEWVALIQKSVYKFKPDADIIFWTYNWGFAPEEDRIKLIENLPDGISLMATWDMFHKYQLGDSVCDIADYSLSFCGPGEYFTSEAIAAKKRNMRLYSMANTSGRTWDLGVIPYEPMPQQWIKRYENILKAREDWGLCGLLENLHYGFFPSFISKLEKYSFFTHEKPINDYFKELLLSTFGEENAAATEAATSKFSEAICHFTPSNEEQYGAFRIGPSYPFWLDNTGNIPDTGKIPSQPHTMFGNSIFASVYVTDLAGRVSLPGVRIFNEFKSLETMECLMQEGIDIMEKCKTDNEDFLRLLNLAKFIKNSVTTGKNAKQFYILKEKLNLAETKESAGKLIEKIENLLLSEKENVISTVPLVKNDSSLGWEPSMEYFTNEKCLNWKLRQLDYELNHTIPTLKQSNNY